MSLCGVCPGGGLCLVAGLQEEVGGVRSIEDGGGAVELCYDVSGMHKPAHCGLYQHGRYRISFCSRRKAQRRNREGWQQITAQSCRGDCSSLSQIPLQNREEALGMVDEVCNEIEWEEPMQALLPRSD